MDGQTKQHHINFWLQVGSGLFLVILLYFVSKFKVKKTSTAETKKIIDQKVKTILTGKYKMKNEQYIDQLNDAVKEKFAEFISDVQKMGYVVAITSGYRTFQEQIILKEKDKRNASPGFSSHNYGTAIDMVLYKDGKMIGKGHKYLQDWINSGVPELAKTKYKMRWGGDFKGYEDEVHFDYNNIYDTKKLYSMAIAKFGSPEKAEGNKLKLT